MKTIRSTTLGFTVLLMGWPALVQGQAAASAILAEEAIYRPVVAVEGMVSSAEAEATRVGLEVLKAGGNAVDAGVAVAAALAVTYPRAGNLGGGGFMLIHEAESDQTTALDFREKAPMAARRDMFLDAEGDADPQLSRYSHLASGVPGTVAGLAHAREAFGTMSWASLLEPAIRLAEAGFTVYPDLHESLQAMAGKDHFGEEARRVFLSSNGTAPEVGTLLRQPELANSLRQIAEEGPEAFYAGPIAEKIAKEMLAHGGLITEADLAAYSVVEREPVRGTYRGHEVLSMPPPSSGGIHIVQMLNILEDYPLSDWGHNAAMTVHHMVEAMKRAYADRAEHLGDTDYVDVPLEGLISKAYADKLRLSIRSDRAIPSADISAGTPAPAEPPETTHFSIVDRWGNAVSCTYTLNFSYGSGVMIPGTGILMNNQMDDFSAKPGVPNAYGLIGGEANAIEPGKRMLSSMSPTLVLRDGEVFIVTGSPGGSRIITTVLQVLMNIIDHGMNPAEAEHAVRFHHQWLPDYIRVERGFNPDTRRLLEEKGHTLKTEKAMGGSKTIVRINGRLYGSADPRRSSGTVLGY
jgi:gamma-glutamyltranspeptidase/glutathione hydrolase